MPKPPTKKPPKPKPKRKLTLIQQVRSLIKKHLAAGSKPLPSPQAKGKKIERLGPDRRRLEAQALEELKQMERRAQRKAKKRKKK